MARLTATVFAVFAAFFCSFAVKPFTGPAFSRLVVLLPGPDDCECAFSITEQRIRSPIDGITVTLVPGSPNTTPKCSTTECTPNPCNMDGATNPSKITVTLDWEEISSSCTLDEIYVCKNGSQIAVLTDDDTEVEYEIGGSIHLCKDEGGDVCDLTSQLDHIEFICAEEGCGATGGRVVNAKYKECCSNCPIELT